MGRNKELGAQNLGETGEKKKKIFKLLWNHDLKGEGAGQTSKEEAVLNDN